MARWWAAGDPDFAPAALPVERDGSAYIQHGTSLWLLGGWNAGYAATTATAYRYDLTANTWTLETPVSFAFESYSRGVAIGDLLYFFTPDGNLHTYNTQTGVTATIGASGVTGYHDLALIGDFIYVGLTGATPRRYDTVGASWSDAPGTSPYASNQNYAAVIEVGNTIFVGGGNGAGGSLPDAYIYTPATGIWTALPDMPEGLQWHSAIYYREQVHILGGEGSPDENTQVFVLQRDRLAWETPYDVMPVGLAGQATGLIFGQVIIAGGYNYTTLDASTTVLMFGAGLDTIDVTADVALSFDSSEAWLTLTADIEAGTVANLLLWAVTGTTVSADLMLHADIVTPYDGTVPPGEEYGEIGDPLETDPPVLIEPGVGQWGADVAKSPGDYAQYSLSHTLDGGVTGTVGAFGRTLPAGLPSFWPALEWESDLAWGWQRGDVVTTTRSATSLTQRAMQETFLPELMPADELESLPSMHNPPPCIHPIDAELCAAASWEIACDAQVNEDQLKAALLPSRRQLARDAAGYAGVSLDILEGTGLYGLDDLVDEDYRTENKTPAQVVSDMLLATSPRTWFLPSVMVIDGRPLPTGSTTEPAADLTTASELWLDAAVAAASIAVERRAAQAPLVAPELADFLKACSETVDGCDGRTFETMENGILEWTEWAGDQRIDHKITKAGGQITQEEHVTYGPVASWSGLGTPWATSEITYEPFERTTITNTYYGCCQGALRSSAEQTHVLENLFGQQRWVLHKQRLVDQRYHAEGWLMSRIESSIDFEGWLTYEAAGVTSYVRQYKRASRSERYRPVGKGIWSVAITTIDQQMKPIYELVEVEEEGETTTTKEVVGVRTAIVSNTYTQMTDGGPPTVSCGDVDPCNPDETCEERANRLYNEALEEYNEKVAIRAAQAINVPDRMLRQTFTIDEAWKVPMLGDVITTSRGEAIVTNVNWSGGTPQSGSPGDRIQVEAWSALP